MKTFIKIGTYYDKILYYNIENSNFYAIDESIEDPNIAFLKEESEFDRIKWLADAKITNDDEIKAIRMANAYILEQIAKEIVMQSKISKMQALEKAQKVIASRRRKRNQIISIVLLCTLFFHRDIINLGNNLKLKVQEGIDDYHHTHQNDDQHLNIFLESLDTNETLDAKVRLAIQSDLNTLVMSDIYIPDNVVKDIGTRISEYDFSNITEDSYIYILPYLIFGESNIVTNMVTEELDEYTNNRAISPSSILFGELIRGDHIKLLEDLFKYGSNSFIKDLAKTYNVSEDEINNLLSIIELVKALPNEARIDEYHQLLGNMIIDCLKGKSVSAYDQYLLSSQIFGGDNEVSNNIFADYNKITVINEDYKKYDLYFDPSSGVDFSLGVYYEKLTKLIKDKGGNLDYQDSDSRFLMYLLYLTHTNPWEYDEDMFTSINTYDEYASSIFSKICLSNTGTVNINPEFIYAYLSSGYINFSELVSATRAPFANEYSIILFREYYACLMEEIKDEDISYSSYEDKFNNIFKQIKNNDINLYNMLMDSLSLNKPLMDNMNLFPLNDDSNDIKKNVYLPN